MSAVTSTADIFPLFGPARLVPSTATQVQTLNKLSTTSSINLPMLRKRRHQRLHCECIQGPPQPANIAEWRLSRYDPTRMRCSMLAAGPPARALRVPDGGVCEPAMLFHGPIVSTMIFIPATALSIWRCTLSTSVFRNSCIFCSSKASL